MPQKITDIVSHFFSKVNKQGKGGCWLWEGRLKPEGYGAFCIQRRDVYAHRFSYELARGPIPKGLVIDHLCRVKHCVNPDHLEVVPQVVNVRRNKEATKTHCKHGHIYNEKNTQYRPNGTRKCRVCQRIRDRAWYVPKAEVPTTEVVRHKGWNGARRKYPPEKIDYNIRP